jgi:glycosidase
MSHPFLYEINTRCWLRDLSAKAGTTVTLANIPDSEISTWQKLGFSHIWLMGVWTTGSRARAEALNSPQLREAYRQVLGDWTDADVPGSPYAIADYEVPAALGGETGLKIFRQKLLQNRLKLVLDFVPNHLGLDHRWLKERPELFVQSPTQAPDTFQFDTNAGPRWFAHGKDPYFPGWTDVVQLDYRRLDTRDAMIELLESVAARCDGVRCDMAMLLLNGVFAKTWAAIPPLCRGETPSNEPARGRSGPSLSRRTGEDSPSPGGEGRGEGEQLNEFWPAVISKVRAAHPDFLFLSEVYWGLEGRMQELGFDFTYDKELYDKLVARDAAGSQRRLLDASRDFVSASAHFLENHDECRVASILPLPEHRAAALAILGLPGMRFLHEGQLTGSQVKIPVQLGRRPIEPAQPDVVKMYEQLLATLRTSAVGRGRAELLQPRAAWPGNPTGQNFVIVQWQDKPLEFDLVVVNLAAHRSQCYAPLNIDGLAERNWTLVDSLGTERYVRVGEDLERQGLYVDLPPHGAQLFRFTSNGVTEQMHTPAT